MPACKACGEWFAKTNPHEELCFKCECALCRLSSYVARVVRCENCRSYNKPKTGWCEVHLDREHPDDFCSNGERKDGDADHDA